MGSRLINNIENCINKQRKLFIITILFVMLKLPIVRSQQQNVLAVAGKQDSNEEEVNDGGGIDEN